MNEDWPRWIFASFAKHFDSLKQSVHLYVEGTDRDTDLLTDFAEFRLDGPQITQTSRRVWVLKPTVNILVQSTMDDKDAYKIQKNVGIMVAAFVPSITGYELGDSGNQFACFNIEGTLRINYFGIIDKDLRKQQATIEASYSAELIL